MNEQNRCVTCPRSVRQRRHHILSLEFLETHRDFVEHMFSTLQAGQEIAFDGSRAICHPCWQRIDYGLRRPPLPPPRPPTASISTPGFARAANTSRRCMIDNCGSLERRAVPNSMKVYLLSYFHLYIPPLARICSHHLRNTTWEDIPGNITRREDDFRGEHLSDIVELYTQALEKKKMLDFEKIDEISPDELHNWIGMSHQQFYSILEETPSLRERSNKNTILGVYLTKLRTGAPYRRLQTVLGLPKATIHQKMKQARECLKNDYVSRHLGFDHITRNEVIARNKIIPNHIFGTEDQSKAIIILDGTYLHIQKSSNFLFQRESYSLHKYSNLVKPFMLVCGDGYIIEVTGPYNARTSDATILKQILDNHSEPMEQAPIRWMKATDLVDFPKMTFDEPLVFAIGTYHVKLARSYCCEHIRVTGVYSIELYRHPERVNFNEEVENTYDAGYIQDTLRQEHIEIMELEIAMSPWNGGGSDLDLVLSRINGKSIFRSIP
ncbi:unnamed protein product [Colias eurytheme]|nr:unnamed protein product [Colias eurytheme]